MKVGDLVRKKWHPEQGQGIILGWTTVDGLPMARLFWFENKTNWLATFCFVFDLVVISESR